MYDTRELSSQLSEGQGPRKDTSYRIMAFEAVVFATFALQDERRQWLRVNKKARTPTAAPRC